MNTKKFLAGVIVACLGIMLPTAGFATALANPIPGVDLGDGFTVYAEQFAMQAGAKSNCLTAVKKWRQDALDTNVQMPDSKSKPSGKTVAQYLSEQGISQADYLDPKWSRDLEIIALARASEAQAFGLEGHQRANGAVDVNVFSIESNGFQSWNEIIAYGENVCSDAIEQWAGEKIDWTDQTGKEVGHYLALIDPKYKHYGFGGIQGPLAEGAARYMTEVWVGNASFEELPDESATELSGPYKFPINIKDSDVANGVSIDTSEVVVGSSVTPNITVNGVSDRLSLDGNWTSADTSIASVNVDGSIQGVAVGSTTITLTTNGRSYAFPFDVHDKAITKVSAFADITTDSGTAPVLPTNASVTYDDNSTSTVPVTWDPIAPSQYSGRAGSEFTVNGTVTGWADPVSITVTVNPATVDSVSPTTFTVTTPSGTAPTLPATTSVTWSNRDTTDETITWETIEPAAYSARDGGTFTVNGTVTGSSDTLTTTVTVTAATVETVATPDEVTTTVEISPVLPETTLVTWSNGDTTDETITWETIDPAAYSTAGSFTASGTVVDEPIDVLVNVVEVSITSVTPPAGVTTNSGTAPVLPTTVQVEFNNNTTGIASVTWDAIAPSEYSGRAGSEFTVNGTVADWADPVSITVTVNPATVDSVSPTTFTITTPSGTAPTLPATTSVTWSNGDTTTETITWDPIDPVSYSTRSGGTFTVSGSVPGWDDPVTAAVTVNAATVSAVGTPTVTTKPGVAPTLPPTVSVTWSNGDVTDEPAVWDEIDPTKYAKEGTFTVNGSASGVTDSVTANVIVAKLAAPASGEVSTQPGKPGIKPAPTTSERTGSMPRTGVDVALLSLVTVLLLGAGGTLLVARHGALK